MLQSTNTRGIGNEDGVTVGVQGQSDSWIPLQGLKMWTLGTVPVSHVAISVINTSHCDTLIMLKRSEISIENGKWHRW